MKSKTLIRLWQLLVVFAVVLPTGLRPSFGKDNPEDKFVHAVTVGDEAKVKDLLALGANVNAPSSGPFGTTAMMQAAQNGHKDIVKILLEYGVDLKSRDTQTALYWSTSKSHFEISSMLLERGVDSRVALVECCRQGNLKTLSFLLDKKVDVSVEDANGTTPLMAASGFGHTKALELLLAKEADVNYQNKDLGVTALMYAVSPDGKLETLKMLVESGANVNLKSKQSWTALMGAVANAHSDMAKFLLAYDADLSVKNSDGQTALDIAVKNGNQEITDLLRKRQSEK